MISNGQKVTTADVDNARSANRCRNVAGQSEDASGRQSRRVAKRANSTSGTGASNLWGRAANYLKALEEANPGTTTRIVYAEQTAEEQEAAKPKVVVYMFVMFTGALKGIVGIITLSIVGLDAAVTKGLSPDDAQVFLLVSFLLSELVGGAC
ncbi:hypothetical protein T484DRAFT_1816792 [Baffinella frigidus]|nr:hypothetical protein T484DRAFT_1816792 [Cryptophyta sp. CCMP2293]